jgi:O-antigen ligase
MIAIISAYAFLYSLEHKLYSIIFFLVGLAGNLSTQVRGSEIALMVCLLILISGRGRISRRSVYLLITGFVASILMFLIILGTVGGERIWNVFNRGQDSAGISSASGRTEVWAFVLQYCMTHPWGMGYVAGFRIIFRQYFSLSSAQTLSNLGTAHNTFMDALAGAGWLGLMFYLVILIKTLKLGGAVANIKTNMKSTIDSTLIHGVRCSYVLLIYCMVFGLDDTDFSAPLRAAFYYLYIIIAIILGASARMIATYRPQHTLRPNDSLWGVETEFKDII